MTDLEKLLKKLMFQTKEFEFDLKDDTLCIHTFYDTPKTFTLKLEGVEERSDYSGLSAKDYRKIIWDICDKYGDCEGCPHAEGYCKDHTSYGAPYYLLKAWAEEMQAKEKELPDMEVEGDLRKQLIAAGLPAGCKVIIRNKDEE